MNKIKIETAVVIREIFYFFSILVVIFVISEMIWPNIILAYLNLNWLLVLWFIGGIIYLKKKNVE